MLKFLKRSSCEVQESERKIAKLDVPFTLCSWNVNGILQRIQGNDWTEFTKFVETNRPSMIGLQEVKLPAHGPLQCKKGDGLPRKRDVIKQNDKVSQADFQKIEHTLSKGIFSEYIYIWSLSDWKYSGVCMLVHKSVSVEKKIFSLEDDDMHEDEGRVVGVVIPSRDGGYLTIINMYAPNIGWKEPSFTRRKEWDQKLKKFIQKQITDLGDNDDLIIMGDLNVAYEDVDLSHPAWFKSQKPDNDIPKEHIGQPGCQPYEIEFFKNFLNETKIIDAYRNKNPRAEPPPVESNEYSWRGHAGKVVPSIGKYYQRGMRIDHALINERLLEKLDSVYLLGYGADCINFFGSDHSPLIVRYK